jgi:hypothetical protein
MKERRLGKHWYRIEEDTVFVRWAGPITKDEMQELLHLHEANLKRHPFIFAFYDLTVAKPLDSESRRMVGEWARSHRLAAIAGFGGSLLMRTIMNLMGNAIRLRNGNAPRILFAEREDEARERLAQYRRSLYAEPTGSHRRR